MLDKSVLEALDSKKFLITEFTMPPVSIMDGVRLRQAAILDKCEGKRVLHLGCTDHLEIIAFRLQQQTYLHRMLTYVSRECLGIDINKEAVDYLAINGITNIIEADITQPRIREIEESVWDILLMPDMLEHIDNPVLFLQRIRNNYSGNISSVIITVPNAFGINQISYVLNRGSEFINADHRYWFTPYTLCKVAYRAGLVIDDITGCIYEFSPGSNAEQYYTSFAYSIAQSPILNDTLMLTAHWE
ncbi:MAG: class I SAM-dependent methyltransferase [Clostridiales bacterium]|jgi:hypothetical protein|nr:class I SAM-dependent methyltransferase [Clostridiales bacterium]